MQRRQRYGTVAALAGIAVAVVVAVVWRSPPPPPPPRPAPIFPAKDPPPHPVIPSEPREEAPKAFCEGRDLFKVGGELRATQKKAAEVAARGPVSGGPQSCHQEPPVRELAGALNALIGRTGACVARDSPLDSQWSQLESAVAALDRCMECTHPRADRAIGCKRVIELVNAAEKSVPQNL